MSILYLVALWVSVAVTWVWRAVAALSVLLGAWALMDTLIRKPELFAAAGKRTKGFWIGVNAAGLAVVLLMGFASMLGLLGLVANAVYLADVRPALKVYEPVRVRSRIRPVGGSGRQSRPGEGWRR